ncbi:biopolymer transporter ExbD [Aestuariicella hydrocarbonica]|uniref:Biopolymer transporter ExbD n=1 Tax=Pseudomaricurvus hydrocarbonicus TaxID=1470433 RepID=A0A9E5MJ60_9GAMM|nr:biopolymer transporter ExbD [Aestuariicella hydrocarbonica]NHO64554.1 biopolymer transporter ExbD [Aestuariicella hydrocarbonica]
MRARRHHYKRNKDQAEIDVTTFLNLMVVLIPFLLITAVFSRITIQELNLPQQAAGGAAPDKPLVTIEVILRQDKLQITDGDRITDTINKVEDKHDFQSLSEKLLALKDQYKEKEDAIILIEPDIEYEDVIRVMDAVKIAEVKLPEQEDIERISLFPKISLGDAP